ncbi:MAG: VOC family protein [Betaproteobacteria bacterium]|nr:VOC family protein [Betaproteobacteria bacterium]MDH3437032.1 VOC family protein [Betaproteobacteria bacterium]
MRLRSVELEMPRAGAAVEFLEGIWGLVDAGKTKQASYLRGTGDHPYVMAIAEAVSPAVVSVTFSGSKQDLERLRSRAAAGGILVEPSAVELDEPGAPSGFRLAGPEGQCFRFVTDEKPAPHLKDPDKPIALTHVPINATDADACTRFAIDVLGFKLSDRTRIMDFIRCDSAHHSLAYVRTGVSALHHMAFEMQDLDAVMRGVGRLRDAGIEPAWGPGRHGPGNNVFAYYVAPFGAVLEYTSEIERVDDTYKVGSPDDWKWPPGRVDHWGLSKRDDTRLHAAERNFRFRSLS